MIHQVVYVSSATEHLSSSELATLLKQAQEKNARNGITGMLLYHEGTFMQAIEGHPQAVETLWQSLKADKRHGGIVEMYRGAVEARQFGNWSMGFWRGPELLRAEPDFHQLVPYDAPPPLKAAAAGRVRTLLLSFVRQLAY